MQPWLEPAAEYFPPAATSIPQPSAPPAGIHPAKSVFSYFESEYLHLYFA
jgi:hypothetical protein